VLLLAVWEVGKLIARTQASRASNTGKANTA
jgi:hypothetical protein